MNWVTVIDKVCIVVAVDIAPVFELRELLPYVRHCGALREGGVHTSGSGFASPGRTTWRTLRGPSAPNSIKEFTTIARKAAVLNSAMICRVLRLKEGMARKSGEYKPVKGKEYRRIHGKTTRKACERSRAIASYK